MDREVLAIEGIHAGHVDSKELHALRREQRNGIGSEGGDGLGEDRMVGPSPRFYQDTGR